MAITAGACRVNSATTIADPGTITDAFGVSTKLNIYITAASDNFTANGVACQPGAQIGGGQSGSTAFNPPFLVTTAVTSATVGTIWYYIQ